VVFFSVIVVELKRGIYFLGKSLPDRDKL